MGSKGVIILPGLLLILSVLYNTGHGLQCYTCLNPGGECALSRNCTPNFDACLFVKAETRTYYQCWKMDDCNYLTLSKYLGEKTLEYRCCQKNLCNKSGGTVITGTTILLVTELLTAFWKFI
ncbi:CD59 glycoprotein [Molossus nigricans]